jgi:hypothetical protein
MVVYTLAKMQRWTVLFKWFMKELISLILAVNRPDRVLNRLVRKKS